MPKYLFKVSYSPEGAQALIDQGGSARLQIAEQLATSVGGSMEAFYFAFGGDDAFVIVDLPDNEAAAAVALTVGASGTVGVETTVLLTAEEMDRAAKRSPSYSPPGS